MSKADETAKNRNVRRIMVMDDLVQPILLRFFCFEEKERRVLNSEERIRWGLRNGWRKGEMNVDLIKTEGVRELVFSIKILINNNN